MIKDALHPKLSKKTFRYKDSIMYKYMYVQKDFKLKGRLPTPHPPKKICYFSKLRPLSIMCLYFHMRLRGSFCYFLF